VYISALQTPAAAPRELLVRTKGGPEALSETIRRAIWTVNPQQPVARIRTMDEWIDLDVADRAQQATLMGIFAGLALLLASIGLYGVLSYAVTQRSREIGVRIALGASTSSVTGMVVRHGLLLTGAGLVSGAAISWAVTRAMTKLLYGVRAMDPMTLG